jgi:hypothetical protein
MALQVEDGVVTVSPIGSDMSKSKFDLPVGWKRKRGGKPQLVMPSINGYEEDGPLAVVFRRTSYDEEDRGYPSCSARENG